uniref:Uncharacterized protein n=1 Tax=Anopheles quadriannulatus TaxID=34691 RepID=A0A182XU24_ANOQN
MFKRFMFMHLLKN